MKLAVFQREMRIIICVGLGFLCIRSVAAQVGEADRRTELEWAREKGQTLAQVREDFGATGVLRCPNMNGSAQVTVRRDVITTAAHLFMTSAKDENAKPLPCVVVNPEPWKCKLELPGWPAIEVKGMVKGGLGFSCNRRDHEDDWAVLELKTAVPNEVIPYKLSPERSVPVRFGDRLIRVSGGDVDFSPPEMEKGANGKWIHPKSIGECLEKGGAESKYPGTTIGIFASDCDGGHGGSGGSVLKASSSGGYDLVGIFIASKGPDTCSWKFDVCESYAAAVTGRLYDLLDSIRRNR